MKRMITHLKSHTRDKIHSTNQKDIVNLLTEGSRKGWEEKGDYIALKDELMGSEDLDTLFSCIISQGRPGSRPMRFLTGTR